MAAVQYTPTELTPESLAEVTKAARIYTNSLVKAAQEALPTADAPSRMQLIVSMGVQAVTTGAGRAFDDVANEGLDASLYEAMLLGLASAVGIKLGVVDPFTREHAMRVFWQGVHGGIATGEEMARSATAKAGLIKP